MSADGDLLRQKIEFETDRPVRPFKRDQHLTPQALFKAKVLAVLERELAQAGHGLQVRWYTVERLIKQIEAIEL